MVVAETRNLSVRYGAVFALDGLSLQLEKGTLLCLLGPNGAGKTTLLNALLGLVRPAAGQALVNGIDVAEDPERARRSIAYIPELVTLYPSLSGIENLRFFSELAGHGRYTQSELERLLGAAGLASLHAMRRVSTYSKGMRQKVAIAIAMAKQAELLLLDEPTSGLDPASANECVAQISALADQGCAVLMTTHDLYRAKASGARVAIMHGGRVVASFDSADLESSQIERAYLDAIGRVGVARSAL